MKIRKSMKVPKETNSPPKPTGPSADKMNILDEARDNATEIIKQKIEEKSNLDHQGAEESKSS